MRRGERRQWAKVSAFFFRVFSCVEKLPSGERYTPRMRLAVSVLQRVMVVGVFSSCPWVVSVRSLWCGSILLRVGRPFFAHFQWSAYQEHFLRFNNPPDRNRSFSQVCAMWARLSVRFWSVWVPVESVNPRDVSSTSASMRRECCCGVSGDGKVILGVMRRSRVFMSVTTRVSQTAGEAPLPWPVPNSGDCGVP